MEVRELEEVLTVLEEHLGDRENNSRIRNVVHRSPGDGEANEIGAAPGHPEGRNDVAARLGDRRGDGLQLAAVDPDREGREVVLRVQAIGVGERVEEDRLVVDERGATGEKVWRSTGPRRWRCAAGGEAGHRALASREIEDYDLDGLLASGPRPEIHSRRTAISARTFAPVPSLVSGAKRAASDELG